MCTVGLDIILPLCKNIAHKSMLVDKGVDVELMRIAMSGVAVAEKYGESTGTRAGFVDE